MEVIALADGFYGGARRRKGSKFEVKAGEKGSWFAPVNALGEAEAKPAAKAKPKARSAAKPVEEKAVEEQAEGDSDTDLVG